MKLFFLGTGAADWPAEMNDDPLFAIHDRSVRRCTASLLDGTVLFDCGPHTFACAGHFGVDLKKIRAVLFTHLHDDHFNENSLRDFAARAEEPLHVYYSAAGQMPHVPHTVLHPIEVGTTFSVEGYTVTALPANHTFSPCHYLVEKENKRFFYGLDGAWMCYDTFYALKKKKLDVLVLDATVGDYEGDLRMAEHNSLPMIRMMEKSFRTVGIMDEHSRLVLAHIARTLHEPYDETVKIASRDGYFVTYDGCTVEI